MMLSQGKRGLMRREEAGREEEKSREGKEEARQKWACSVY